jgi:hypothetical protein
MMIARCLEEKMFVIPLTHRNIVVEFLRSDVHLTQQQTMMRLLVI